MCHMKDITFTRKTSQTRIYQLIVVVNFNRVISDLRLIESRLIINIPTAESRPERWNDTAGLLVRDAGGDSAISVQV